MLCFYCRQIITDESQAWEGLHRQCFCDWFGISEPIRFDNIAARSSQSVPDEFKAITTSFFHGKFRKYSAQLGDRHYILKVEQEDVPALPATEYLCNQIALTLGLHVPAHYLIRFEGTLTSFVVDNFMYNREASNLIHIYRFLDSPNNFTCEGILKIIEKIVGKFTDVCRFIELCLFDALIGNHDRHGRNFALIQTSGGYELAPFYDNPSYLAIEIPALLSARHEPRGAIATKSTLEPTMIDYVNEWQRLGMIKIVSAFAQKIKMNDILILIEKSFIEEKRKAALITLIERRYGDLCDAL